MIHSSANAYLAQRKDIALDASERVSERGVPALLSAGSASAPALCCCTSAPYQLSSRYPMLVNFDANFN